MVNITTLGRTLEQIDRIKIQQEQFNTLSQQMTSGKKTQRFTGLGTDDILSLRGRSQLSQLETYISNINRGDIRIETMARKVEEFEKQALIFSEALADYAKESELHKGNVVTYQDPLDADADELKVGYDSAEAETALKDLQTLADKLFTLLGDIMNFQDGDRYVFGGSSGNQKPYNDTGSLDTTMSNLLNKWKDGTITTDELMADLKDGSTANGNADAITDSLIGFSSELSTNTAGDVYIRADQGTQVEYTTLANESGFRDILVGLSLFKSADLTPLHDVYTTNTYPAAPNENGAPGTTVEDQRESFFELFSSVEKMINQGVNEVRSTQTRLSQARIQLDSLSKAHVEDKQLLESTVSEVEDIDINEVALRITTLQTNLQASYSVTGLMRDLTLTNFL